MALFAGAVLGFPLASILVAKPLRNFGKYTITDFLSYRYPHAVVRYLVPILIVAAFTIYIVAQLKAAGITSEALLGIPYDVSLTLATVVVTFALARRVGASAYFASLGALYFAARPSIAIHAMNGLETAGFTFLVATAILVRRSPPHTLM